MTEKTDHYAFRLQPGQDLYAGIEKLVTEKQITAGWIATCVGSLTHYAIRFANLPGASIGAGHFEIVSLVGTVSINGSHLHLCISDSSGKTVGGHLLPGCRIFTTAELVITSISKYSFTRENDDNTHSLELQVKENIKVKDYN